MNKYFTKLMIYHEIHKLAREGHSISYISEHLILDRRTVSHYLRMSEVEFDRSMERQSERKRGLRAYEGFVKGRLELHRDTSAAQMHDWLKEHHEDFPLTAPKTVFNFVAFVRTKYNLPKERSVREFEMVAELPYGQQAQVDFGQYNMRDNAGRQVKVYFFVLVLSRSRHKYVWFLDRPFTSESAILAHEQAFEFIRGVPQSKGKVENVVKYTKQNFLYNRPFEDIDTLNNAALDWLGRTANMMIHNGTKKVPHDEWIREQALLGPYTPYPIKPLQTAYTVRKDNIICWKSNFYSLPLGTYKGRGSTVMVRVENGQLWISDPSCVELCRHSISIVKGARIKNSDHCRDKSSAVQQMMAELSQKFKNPELARSFLNTIQQAKPRYMRDQILILRPVVEKTTAPILSKALEYCCANKIASAADFKAVVLQMSRPEIETPDDKTLQRNPLNGTSPDISLTHVEQSSIEVYQKFMQN